MATSISLTQETAARARHHVSRGAGSRWEMHPREVENKKRVKVGESNESTWRRGKIAENRCCANMRRPQTHAPRRSQLKPATAFPQALGSERKCIKERLKSSRGLVWASQTRVPGYTWRRGMWRKIDVAPTSGDHRMKNPGGVSQSPPPRFQRRWNQKGNVSKRGWKQTKGK